MTEIWNLQALCRCCHDDGEFRSLSHPYKYKNEIEVYFDMLRDTFGLSVNPPSFEASNFICDDCIYKLRDATRFKKLVMACEDKFQEYCRNELNDSEIEIKLKPQMKNEFNCSSNSNVNIKNESVSPKYESSDDDNFAGNENVFESKIEDDAPSNEAIVETENDKVMTRQKRLVKKGNTKRIRTTSKKPEHFCFSCKIQFLNKNELNIHKNKFHSFKRTNFECDMCISEDFADFSKLKEHLLITHDVKQVKCSQCEIRFSFKGRLLKHESRHKFTNRLLQCDICKKIYKSRSLITRHMLWHMGKIKTVSCNTCGHTFSESAHLKSHIEQVHLNLKKYSCTKCEQRFKTNKLLKKHHKILHEPKIGDKRARLECEYCDSKYSTELNYKNHMTLKHGTFDIKERYNCDICEKTFCFSQLLKRHMSHHNKTDIEVICDVCGLSMSSQNALNRHMDKHLGKNRKNFQCKICSKYYTTKFTLIRHQTTHIEPVKELARKCDVCNRIIKKHFESHMRVHAIRPARCNICGKSYHDNKTLNRHIQKVHSLNRPYPCTGCEKRFTKKAKLAIHFRKNHSYVEKPCKVEIDIDFDGR